MEKLRPVRNVIDICPWRSELVTLVRVSVTHGIEFANTLEGKRELLALAVDGDAVLVCWPGNFAQDIFDLAPAYRDAVMEQLGMGEAS